MKTKTKTERPLRGQKLLKAAVNQILLHPETWNQEFWNCGTKHCIGGWCQVLGGIKDPPDDEGSDWEATRDALGISEVQARYLFSVGRNLREIHAFAKHWKIVDTSLTLFKV